MQTDGIIKPMEIAFGDIKHIMIDSLLVEYHCVLFYIWVRECPKYRANCTQNDFVAANIAAIMLPRFVCLDPYSVNVKMLFISEKSFGTLLRINLV